MALDELVLAPVNQTVTGVIDAAAETVGIDATDIQSVSVQIAGTWVGTLVLEQSNDNVNWVAKSLVSATGADQSTIASAAQGIWAGDISARYLRVRASAWTSGSVNVTVYGISESSAMRVATQPVSGSGNFAVTMAASATGSPAKAEDAAHASADVGVFTLGVRRDAPTVDASAAGDYAAFKVDQHGAQIVRNLDSQKRTYAAGAKFAPVAGIIFEMSGVAAPAVIEINRITLTLFGTAAGACDFVLTKTSALATGGTAVAMTKVPYDSADAAAGATVRHFTAAPAAGAAVGVIRQGGIVVPAANQYSDRIRLESGQYSKSIMLLSATQAITLALAGTLPTGAQVAVDVEWTDY
jgi:hypothetical protein